jgi:antitoxin component of MazEF toxin-antitoxin module
MPAKEIRKIQATGDSVAVTIPKPYADYHDLKPGKPVALFYDDLMVVVPPGSERKLKDRRKLLDKLLR